MNELEAFEAAETQAQAGELAANELEYINSIEGLQPEKWGKLSLEKRQGVLQELENKMAEIQGRQPSVLLIGKNMAGEAVRVNSALSLVNGEMLKDASRRQEFIDAIVGTPRMASTSSLNGMYIPSAVIESFGGGEIPRPNFEIKELPPTEKNGEISHRNQFAEYMAAKAAHSDLPEVPEDRMWIGDFATRKEFDIEPFAETGDGVPVYRYMPYFSQVKGEFIAPVYTRQLGWQYVKFPAEGAARTEFVKGLQEQNVKAYEKEIMSDPSNMEMMERYQRASVEVAMRNMEEDAKFQERINRIWSMSPEELRAYGAELETQKEIAEIEAKDRALMREMGEHEQAWAKNMTREQMLGARDAGLSRIGTSGTLFENGAGDLYEVDYGGNVRKW